MGGGRGECSTCEGLHDSLSSIRRPHTQCMQKRSGYGEAPMTERVGSWFIPSLRRLRASKCPPITRMKRFLPGQIKSARLPHWRSIPPIHELCTRRWMRKMHRVYSSPITTATAGKRKLLCRKCRDISGSIPTLRAHREHWLLLEHTLSLQKVQPECANPSYPVQRA